MSFSDISSARQYLVKTANPGSTMTQQHPEIAIGRLNPTYAIKLANAIQEARAQGINAGVYSAFRTPQATGSAFDKAGHSLHSYGLATDIAGIGGAGSGTAKQWYKIATDAGIYNPYGYKNPREFNHFQAVPEKTASQALRSTLNRDGTPKLGADGNPVMWAVAGLPSGFAPDGQKLPPADIPNVAPTSATLRKGMSDRTTNGAVSRLQQQLADVGLYKGKVDGDYGPQTAAAVRAAETAYGLNRDRGVAGPQVQAALAGTGQTQDIMSARSLAPGGPGIIPGEGSTNVAFNRAPAPMPWDVASAAPAARPDMGVTGFPAAQTTDPGDGALETAMAPGGIPSMGAPPPMGPGMPYSPPSISPNPNQFGPDMAFLNRLAQPMNETLPAHVPGRVPPGTPQGKPTPWDAAYQSPEDLAIGSNGGGWTSVQGEDTSLPPAPGGNIGAIAAYDGSQRYPWASDMPRANVGAVAAYDGSQRYPWARDMPPAQPDTGGFGAELAGAILRAPGNVYNWATGGDQSAAAKPPVPPAVSEPYQGYIPGGFSWQGQYALPPQQQGSSGGYPQVASADPNFVSASPRGFGNTGSQSVDTAGMNGGIPQDYPRGSNDYGALPDRFNDQNHIPFMSGAKQGAYASVGYPGYPGPGLSPAIGSGAAEMPDTAASYRTNGGGFSAEAPWKSPSAGPGLTPAGGEPTPLTPGGPGYTTIDMGNLDMSAAAPAYTPPPSLDVSINGPPQKQAADALTQQITPQGVPGSSPLGYAARGVSPSGGSGSGFGGSYFAPSWGDWSNAAKSSGYSTGIASPGYASMAMSKGYSMPADAFTPGSGGAIYSYKPNGQGGGTYVDSHGNVHTY